MWNTDDGQTPTTANPLDLPAEVDGKTLHLNEPELTDGERVRRKPLRQGARQIPANATGEPAFPS